MIKNYLKIGWRYLVKNKISAFINILGLTIAISTCFIIYLITSFELSYDNFHNDKDRIYRVVSDEDDNYPEGKLYISNIPYHGAVTIRKEFTGIDKIAAFFSYSVMVAIPEGGKNTKKFDIPEYPEIIIAEPQYFDIFGYEWLAGNKATALNQPLKVVLTESKAHIYFGSLPIHEIIGKEVIYDDSLRLTVSGIVKDLGKNTDLIFKDFISFSTIQNSFLKHANGLQGTNPYSDDWSWVDGEQIFVKLAGESTVSQIVSQTGPLLKKFKENFAGTVNRKVRISLQPLSDLHFNSLYRDDYSTKAHLPTLYFLMGIAAFILIIAAINFINLSTAQSLRRAKEIGIRKVLGSDRASLVFQFLSETFLLVFFAVLLSIILVYPVFTAFQAIIPQGVIFRLASPYTFIFLLFVTVITTLLAGFYPAKVLSSYLPVASLKGQGISNQKSFLRKSLIVFQFTVSLLFIIGTITIGRQVHFMQNKDMGFVKDAIINITMYDIAGKYPTDRNMILAEKIGQLHGIERVSISQEPPEVNYHRGGWLRRKDKGSTTDADARAGDEYYIPLYGLKIIVGRNFVVPQGGDSLTEFLITETCARQLGFEKPEDAIGHVVEPGYFEKTEFYPQHTGPVVGVLADFHTLPLQKSLYPAYILASKTLYYAVINIKLSSRERKLSDFKTSIATIEKQWKEVYPNEKFKYSFFDETLARYYENEQKTSLIMNATMGIAIFISCMGLFGLATFSAVQRTKEIGIRKVLGASVAGIVGMLSKDFIKLVVISFLIASPIAWWFMDKWLQDFAYRIKLSWWIFAIAGCATILITLLTVSYQTIKAAIANPVKCLRTE